MSFPPSALVLGLGTSGEAAAGALLERGLAVTVIDSAESPELQQRAEPLRRRSADVLLGVHDPARGAAAELVVASPGIPPSEPTLRAALDAGVRVIAEVELGWLLSEGRIPVIGVTGTNGKTTTTTLLARILVDGGQRRVVAAGNIGYPLTAAVRERPRLIVCELSSFQLAFIDSLRPEAAVLLNIDSDHLDWHCGRDNYFSAKARITENQTSEDLFVFRGRDPRCLSVAAGSRARLGVFGTAPPGALSEETEAALGRSPEWAGGVEEGRLVLAGPRGRQVLAGVADIRLTGLHNLENVLAASLVAMDRGVSMEAVGETIRAFEGLPHRLSKVGEIGGVAYIDDSKSTNPHATLRAMEGLEKVVLIAGGRGKGVDLSPLAEARPDLVGVVVMGEAAADLQRVFAGLPVRRAGEVEEAVMAAASMARLGDTVLLSPACSSLDQYSGYEERGRRFAQAVGRL